ncbi:MAG: glycosyltransferase [Candidatus Levybacteria bacterium]|nr:glycosyltransferase [Candidatus Levybacteria bacterium]MBI2622680.1 glycosyltransferase [Candidatus Levybacteria bacterium]
MRVALVYDRINKWGGAERLLLALHELFPKASLHTSVYHKKKAPWAQAFDVRTSFLQHFPLVSSSHEFYPLLMPLAFESFSFDEYDLVISVTSEAAKGIITKPKTLHICYCLTPTRYLWSGYEEYFKNGFFRKVSQPFVFYLRTWDRVAAQRPDAYIAISKEVQGRIKKYYRRESEVVYPPVTLLAARGPATTFPMSARSSLSSKLEPNELRAHGSPSRVTPRYKSQNGYFLIVSRLVPYKRIDIAVEAFNKLKLPLKIIGVGSEGKRLKSMAGPTIEFLGNLTDVELVSYYKGCRALIFPGREDFGLTVIEAQSFGKPVIAFKGGGAEETVIAGKTGIFFYDQTSNALAKTVKQFQNLSFNSKDCVEQARKFNKIRFKEELMALINEFLAKKKNL